MGQRGGRKVDVLLHRGTYKYIYVRGEGVRHCGGRMTGQSTFLLVSWPSRIPISSLSLATRRARALALLHTARSMAAISSTDRAPRYESLEGGVCGCAFVKVRLHDPDLIN